MEQCLDQQEPALNAPSDSFRVQDSPARTVLLDLMPTIKELVNVQHVHLVINPREPLLQSRARHVPLANTHHSEQFVLTAL